MADKKQLKYTAEQIDALLDKVSEFPTKEELADREFVTAQALTDLNTRLEAVESIEDGNDIEY